MSTLFADPLGRELLTLLTTDHGVPGTARRIVLLQGLHALRVQAESEGASVQVRGAIHAALWALRAEFPSAPGMRAGTAITADKQRSSTAGEAGASHPDP